MSTKPSSHPPPPVSSLAGLPPRYELKTLIDGGGQGDVYRAVDHRLKREVAIKILFDAGKRIERQTEEIEREVSLTERLQHRGIVAVYDTDRLPDGRAWFAMRAVRGKRLDHWLADLRGGETRLPVRHLRLVVAIMESVARVVAYAHQEGVVHCDIKPANLMIDEHNEVQVLDWGVARPTGDRVEEALDPTVRIEDGRAVTRTNRILGTPHYMAPERAMADRPILASADVYAIGVILYEILVGRLPYVCPPEDVVRLLRSQPPPSIFQVMDSVDRDVRDLQAIVERAMARTPEERQANGGVLAEALARWLRVFNDRLAADQIFRDSEASAAALATLRAERALVSQALMEAWIGVQPHDDIERKQAAWGVEDRLRALSARLRQRSLELEQQLHAALQRDRQHPRANRSLAALYRQLAEDAEGAHQPELVETLASRVKEHDQGEHQAWLEGLGRLSLTTDPPGCRVIVHSITERDRRRRPDPLGHELGSTPVYEVPLRQGSYLVRLVGPDGAGVAYPVFIRRGAHWDGIPPDALARQPVAVLGPRAEEDCYVPAGWFQSGGDPLAPDGLEASWRWIDGFLMERFPVTNARYLDFLNALSAAGEEERARRFCPRESGDAPGLFPEIDGRFRLPDEARFQPDVPVTLVDWHGACAFARWQAERTGRPWRLPHSLEWEKAARGVDGRMFPWGNYPEPTYANMLRAHAEAPQRTPVNSFPSDESVYGVRGLAGNVRDWCQDLYRRMESSRRVVVREGDFEQTGATDWRSVRGGAYSTEVHHCRGAARVALRDHGRLGSLGFRLACSVDRR